MKYITYIVSYMLYVSSHNEYTKFVTVLIKKAKRRKTHKKPEINSGRRKKVKLVSAARDLSDKGIAGRHIPHLLHIWNSLHTKMLLQNTKK